MFEIDAGDLPKFMVCNGSRLLTRLERSISNTETRDEGNAAHYMACAAWNKEFELEELIERKAPNGVYMTPEMYGHVQEYLSLIDASPDGQHFMEYETNHSGTNWIVKGRADHLSHVHDYLNINDLKYGFRIVEPVKNWTLVSHAVAYCIKNAVTPAKINMSIFQPRAYHPEGTFRTWTVTYSELLDLYAELNATLTNPSDTLNTSSFCGKCLSLTCCPAATKAEMNAVDASDIAYDDDISNDVLAFELDTLTRAQELIKHRLDAFTELAKYRVKQGQVVENWSLEQGLGNTTWHPFVTAEMLHAVSGKDVSERKLPTPKQAMQKGIPESIVKPLTHRPKTGLKLKRIDANKRASMIFNRKDK